MTGIKENLEIIKLATDAVNKWEKHSIATTDLDGPLSLFGKQSLIKTISDLLAERTDVLKVKQPLEENLDKPKRKVGRPPKCQSLPSETPQVPSLDNLPNS